MDPHRCLSRVEEGEALVSVPEDGEADNDSDSRITERSYSHPESGSLTPIFPQDSINEEDLLRYREQRLLRRRRLFVRPAVVLVLGFFVFRNTNNPKFFFRSNHNAANNIRQDTPTIVSANGNSNNYNMRAGASLLDSYPTASAYNMAVDLNDDGNDSSQEVSIRTGIGIDDQEQQQTNNEAENTADTDSSNRSNKKKRRDKNDTSYGWIPEVYPDPMIDPVRCGIAYLLSENLSTGTTAEEERRGGLVLGAGGANANTTSDDDSSKLRLCDPDWVLGGVYLEDIAQKMREFSDRFTPRDLVPILPEGELEAQKPEDRQGLTLAVATVRKVRFNFLVLLFGWRRESNSFSSSKWNTNHTSTICSTDEYSRRFERRTNVLRLRR